MFIRENFSFLDFSPPGSVIIWVDFTIFHKHPDYISMNMVAIRILLRRFTVFFFHFKHSKLENYFAWVVINPRGLSLKHLIPRQSSLHNVHYQTHKTLILAYIQTFDIYLPY